MWDFPGELSGNSIDSLESKYMQPISKLSNGGIMGVLSSAPSEILAPTLEALSNMRSPNPAERLRYERKKRFASHGYSGSKIVQKIRQGPTSKTEGLDGSEHW